MMVGKIDARLAELGIQLPKPTAPVANYVPFVIVGSTAFISGQITIQEGKVGFAGKVGTDLTVEQGYQAARVCGLNLLAQLREACSGDLDRVRRVVKLGGFVNAAADFKEHPKVINGASDLMVEVFGNVGRHARFAVGVPSLPSDTAVEVDGIFEIG